MKKNNKGFVVSAVLYPMLVLFLALIMGLLAMSDIRKRILDKMKLEISDSIFDESTCSCDTILNKLNYLIRNGVAGGGGGGGSYTYNVLGLNVKIYESPATMPNVGNAIGDIAVISTTEMPENNYYVATTPPREPKEGTVWIVQDRTSSYYVESDYSKIGISYVMQYEEGIWNLKQSYVFQDGRWQLLRFVALNGSDVDLSGTNLNAQIEWKYEYTGEYQVFQPVFSGYYQIELWGAQGGTNNASYPGGLGAYTKGKIYLNAGEILYIYVGQQGQTLTGGWNGGGLGYAKTSGSAGGGGGATDVRLEIGSTNSTWDEFKSLKSRIMVAAGGGGGSYYDGSWYAKGAAGGGLIGYSGTNTNNLNAGGTGGTQSFGGIGAHDGITNLVTKGGFGKGGRYYGNYSQGGGGSGYFGGGGGAHAGASGGGGSSYISGHNGCNSLAESATESSLELLGSRYHYTGLFFKDTEMIDGAGYNWVNGSKKIQVFQPKNDGTGTQTGQSGNGYAKIRLLTVEYFFPEELETEIKENDIEFHYDGAEYYQTFTAKEAGTYQIELWGAQGSYNRNNYAGGRGAYTSGKIYLKKNETLYLYVGTGNIGQNGGWNGGGLGLAKTSGGAGGGGGATDVRLVNTSGLSIWDEFESLKSRIMVAAGGGGGSYYDGSWHDTGGHAGGLEGYSGSGSNSSNKGNALPGTQALGGSSFYTTDSIATTKGDFGKGGRHYGNYSQGGGGGGYYGGGGGGHAGAGGGGGSSYISGHAGCETITETSTPLDIVMNGSSVHYSGYYFTDDIMIDGTGYQWTTKKDAYIQMPTFDGTARMDGNTGSGHAKIKFISNTTKTDAEIERERLAKDAYFTFEPNGNKYTVFTVAQNGTYKVELWGASGQQYNGQAGGLGAYTSGEIYLKKGTTLYVYLGERKNDYYYREGGWNGGATGSSITYGSAGGGGGATDIRLTPTSTTASWNEFESLKSRIMVAAGGGGGVYYDGSWYGTGGAGGGLIGNRGSGNNGASGGGQGYGGTGANNNDTTLAGFGYGGTYYGSWSEGGGGGGYFGGGGGAHAGAPGGGGSSYISGHNGCNSLTQSSTKTNLIFNGSPVHYSGYYFTNTTVVDGTGYSWGVIKGDNTKMPTHDADGLMTGNSGNGYAKITLVTADSKSDATLSSERAELNKERHFSFTSYYQVFEVPQTGTYQVELWGAQGFGWVDQGGLGAYTKGNIYLTEGTKLYVYVGNGGLKNHNGGTYIKGGWNGGGLGSSISEGAAGGGGGSTDIRTFPTTVTSEWNEFESLKSRIMVAAGGGGGAYHNASWRGGGAAGGGLEGYIGGGSNANNKGNGTGGTQAIGGSSLYDTTALTATKGGFGSGGNHRGTWSHGGGGSGWYGGGAGGHAGGVGGGGSSYISGHAGCETITESSTPLDIVMNGSSLHYNGYYFTDDVMIDGAGYQWTTKKEAYIQMPTYDGKSLMNGNSGSGHARIKFISNETKTAEKLEKERLAKDTYFTFEPNGNKYTVFTALQDGTYKVELWGASGQQYNGKAGGLGAYTSGNIYLKKGTTLYVYLGERKLDYYYREGGWNGGAAGSSISEGAGGGGGGATDIRILPTSSTTVWNEFESLKSRIMVAAGGGGGVYHNASWYGTGGAGGGLTGYRGSGNNGASGGRQGYGGTGANNNDTTLGGFGYAGTYYGTWSEGGGGGGYFGGGSGAHAGAPGGGGSSYISGHNGCNSLTQSSTKTNLIFNGSSLHYSGYYFTNTTVVDGAGYSWGVLKGDNTQMPNHAGDGLMTGNSGNGYAKITLVNTNPKTDQTLTNEKTELNKERHFSFTSYYQVFEVEQTGNYQIELWGAQGFGWVNQGGLGAYTKGNIYLTEGTKLYVYVGNGGLKNHNGGTYIKGGWNGGGLGSSISDGAAGGGGGATDIRIIPTTISSVWNESTSLKSRIMVAAGGGGGAYHNASWYGTGGAAGGLTGYIGSGSNSGNKGNGTGGTQIDAGFASYDATATTATKGGFGFGGNHRGNWSHGGGGSGWYGGGAGGHAGGVGGGGSSYISGHEGCIGINSSGGPLATTYTKLADSLAWNGYKFTNTYMVDGAGYQWTTVKQTINYGMPTWDNSTTMTGNATEGHAKITYLGA